MQKKLVTIGHITHELEPYNNIGGGVSFTGIVANKLGFETTIITKCPTDHPYLDKLEKMGIKTINIPSKKDTITTFKSIYDQDGNKIHYIVEQQEPITNDEIRSLHESTFEKGIILIATVLSEVSTSVIPYLSRFGNVCLAPQGYFREIASDGLQLNREPGIDFLENAKTAQIVILSEEDLSFAGTFQKAYLEQLKQICPLLVLTRGARGAEIYEHGRDFMHIEILKLSDSDIKDFSGSGDTFAAAFIIAYSKVKDLKLAGTFASLYAALKITAKSGIGIDSIPSKNDILEFIENHPEKVKTFLEKNKVTFEAFNNLLL
jgi:sugar/nucleoside kinase (ribokinase family)